ncbi:MAG: cystathionine gamma-synthase [Chitinophagaceae bacterium]|nr:MAG: cystathionine gamma-synthase [Chitinophagaceae bacterium]
MKNKKYKFGTKAIHAGIRPDSVTGAIMTPIYQTSTYVQEAVGVHKGFEYSRTQNPTRAVLEENLAALENGNFAVCFASGMAAIDTIIKLCKPGDEIVVTNDLYGGTYRVFSKVYADYGLIFHYVDMRNLDEVPKKINSKTKLIWAETPTNPMLSIIDIKSLSEIAHKNNCLLCVDNTFATPYLQNPLDLGADLVIHSGTKYLGGHSDVVHGAVIGKDMEIYDKLSFYQNSCGGVPGPQDCFLMLRGIKTLHIRMDRHSENAIKIAEFLMGHEKVDGVFYPGLKDHPNHAIATSQMKKFGGMLSFKLKNADLEETMMFCKQTKLFALAESLGGVESLIGHPATMTHAAIPQSEREKSGISNNLIRLSVGIEDVEDLINDLREALEK